MTHRNGDAGLMALRRRWVSDRSDTAAAAAYLSAMTRAGGDPRAIMQEVLDLAPPPSSFAPREFLDSIGAHTIDTREGLDERQRQRLSMAARNAFERAIEVVLVDDSIPRVIGALERGDLSNVASDLDQGPGLYLHSWVDRRIMRQVSRSIYGWLEGIADEGIGRIGEQLRLELAAVYDNDRITKSEAERLATDLERLAAEKDLEARRRWLRALVSLYTPQPYGIDFTVLAERAGFRVGLPEVAIAMIGGRFVDRLVVHGSDGANWLSQTRNRWIDSFGGDAVYRLPWCRTDMLDNVILATLGLHGSFCSSGWHCLTRFCVWDPRAVRRIRPARLIGEAVADEGQDPVFVNAAPLPELADDEVGFLVAPATRANPGRRDGHGLPGRWRLVELAPSWVEGKKWAAVFHDEVNDRPKTTHFGAVGYEDYTMHRDRERKTRYLERHGRGREDWEDPTTAGALSRWILWNKPTIEASVADFRRRFGV